MGAAGRLTAPRIVAPPGAAHTLAEGGARATSTGEPAEELGEAATLDGLAEVEASWMC